jgi:predicted nucleic acid-binding protein
MSRYVVDAGVAAKWFIPEPDSDKARRLLESYNQGADDLIAPDLIIAEAANVFWKRAGRGDITTQNAEEGLSDLLLKRPAWPLCRSRTRTPGRSPLR